MTDTSVNERREEKPKQFGIRAVMAWVTLASLIMGAFAVIDTAVFGAAVVCCGGVIAIAQRSEIGRRQPILTSMLAGAAICGLLFLLVLPSELFLGPVPFSELAALTVVGIVYGLILGFFVGVVVHALFLVFHTNIPSPDDASAAPSSTKGTTLV